MAVGSRNSNFVLHILILFMGALAIPLLHGAAAVVLVACLCGAAVGVLILYEMYIGRRYTKLTGIMAAALLTGYCGGCAITQSLCGLDQSGVTDAGWNAVPAAWGAYTIALVLGASALLLIADWVEPPLLKSDAIITVGREEEWLIWIGLAILILEIFQGQFGYEGTTAEGGTHRVSILGEISRSFLLIIPPLAAIGWMQSRGFRRFRFGLIVLASLILNVPVGRRALVYCLLVTLFAAARLSGVRISLSRRTRWLGVILGGGCVMVLTVLFLSIRMASDNLGPANHPLSQILPETEEVLQNPSYVLRATEENLESRPFLLTQYLSLLTKGGNAPGPMYGADLIFSVQSVVPDSIYQILGRSKDRVRAISMEEGLANEHFHLPVFDDANSILTSGFIDLGVLGLAIYPIGICVLWRIALFDVRGMLGRKAALLFLLIALNTFLQAEEALSGYLVELRDGLIILAVWMALSAIPSLLPRSRRWQLSRPQGKPLKAASQASR